MIQFISAFVPVIVVIALGAVLARGQWISADGWRGLEKLSYNILFPAMIIRALANAPLETTPWRMVGVLAVAQLLLGGLGFLAHWQPGLSRASVGSIIQSNVRWQTTIGLSIARLMFGDAGLALASIAAAVMIPLANVLSVFALLGHADHPPETRVRPLTALLANPLLWACAIGISIALSGWTLPKMVNDTIGILGGAGLAAGLITAGAGLDFKVLKDGFATSAGWALVRLMVMPLFVLFAGRWLGLPDLELYIAIICAATPTATSGFILARQLGGDPPLSASLILMTNLFAVLTLPLVWAIAHL